MFGISGMELAIVMLVALLVLGPDRLPQVARFLARLMRELRRASDEVRMHIDPDLDAYRSAHRDIMSKIEEVDTPARDEPPEKTPEKTPEKNIDEKDEKDGKLAEPDEEPEKETPQKEETPST